MKKVLLSLVALWVLAGCATISEDRLYQAKAVYGVALSQAVTYRRLCINKQLGPLQPNCRSVVAKLAGYDRNAQQALANAKANPAFITVAESAVAVFRAASDRPGEW